MDWWQVLVAAVGGLLVLWLALLVALAIAGRRDGSMNIREALRLLPDVLRLLRALATDPDLPRGVRIRLGLLLGYLLFPIDVIPDFIPVLGYADDVIVVAMALRSVVRRAGPDALARHWTGSPDGLRVILRLAGISHS